MSTKRKRVVLSLNQKMEIIARLNKGESGQKLANEFGVGKSTITGIKNNSDSISRYAHNLDSEVGSSSRKTMKKAKSELLEDAVYTWFLQKRSSGQPLSGPILCEKALQLNMKLGGDQTFTASSGWLKNFKLRHGIRQIEIHGEKLSADAPAAVSFSENLKKHLEDNKYDLDFVYNADKTGLYWKTLPSKSLVSRKEAAAPGYKMSKDRVTVMVCANATGTHRIPLLMIGKSKNPRCFKNVKLPLIYTSQKNAWMNSDLFIKWFENNFIPEVKKFQQDSGKQGRVLLLLDNAPSHPSPETLNKINDMFEVKFFPPNVTSLVQPMDQSVIETLKKLYRKQFMRLLLLGDKDDEESIFSTYKKINLKYCCYMLFEAWNGVKNCTLHKSWNKLLKSSQDQTEIREPDAEISAEMVDTLSKVSVFAECDEKNVNEWLSMDSDDPGYQLLTDDEIVHELLHDGDPTEVDDPNDDPGSGDDSGPSHAEAFQALDLGFRWFERQEESDLTQLLQLKRIRDLAAMKRKSKLKQSSIKQFFMPQH